MITRRAQLQFREQGDSLVNATRRDQSFFGAIRAGPAGLTVAQPPVTMAAPSSGSSDADAYASPESLLFSDGLGDRIITPDAATGDLVQVLRINPALTAVPSFEFALRERVARLANFRHLSYARIRRVDRAQGHPTALAVVSDHIEGTRLSDILRVAEQRRLHLDINAALCLLRQLVPALAVLHENARDTAHGLVAPERLVITAHGRLVVAEHVCGAAIEQMQYGRERLWHELRVAMPPSAGIPRFDQRADVTGIGVVALSLVLGRLLRTDEFPRGIHELLNEARERTALGDEAPISAPLRGWLASALQVEPRRAFASTAEARAALEQLTAENPAYVPAPVALETFLSRYLATVLVPAPLAPAVLPAAGIPALDALETNEHVLDLPELTAVPTAAPEPLFNAQQPFTADVPPPAAAAPPATRAGTRRWWMAAAAATVILAAGGFAGVNVMSRTAAPALAILTVQSTPSGVPVFVDGVDRGVTPARITLAPGAHILELRRGVPRVIPLTLTAGADVSQYIEFAATEPAAAPLLQASVEPIPAPPVADAAVAAAPLGGWITARLPFVVEIRQQGRLLGTTEAERLMLAAGAHQLEFVNQALGYRATRTVQVHAGRTTAVTLDLPKGTINLNAVPWAEVWLDGRRVGETPIGNLPIDIGAHEIVFKHPQLGEKRHAVSVAVGKPVRISVDMK